MHLRRALVGAGMTVALMLAVSGLGDVEPVLG